MYFIVILVIIVRIIITFVLNTMYFMIILMIIQRIIITLMIICVIVISSLLHLSFIDVNINFNLCIISRVNENIKLKLDNNKI